MKTIALTLFITFFYCTANSQIVTTFFGSLSQQVDDAMAFDTLGNLFGSNFDGTTVYKVSPAGITTVFADEFVSPKGLAFDSQQNLYVADMGGNRIYKLSHSGLFLDTFYVDNPAGIIKSPTSDTMIFTQFLNNAISTLAPDGTIDVLFNGAPLNGPVGLAFNDDNTLYVSNFNNREVYNAQNGILNYVATIPGVANSKLGSIAFAQGTLWGSGYSDHTIYRIYIESVDNVVAYAGNGIAGSDDGELDVATFNAPNGLVASLGGDSLFISDYATGSIRILSEFENETNTIGINEMIDFTVFPNPAVEKLTVKSEKEILHTEVRSLDGTLLIDSKEKEIDLKELAQGVYMVQVYTNSGNGVCKVLKQ